METKYIAADKPIFKNLSTDELHELVSFEKSELYKILVRLAGFQEDEIVTSVMNDLIKDDNSDDVINGRKVRKAAIRKQAILWFKTLPNDARSEISKRNSKGKVD